MVTGTERRDKILIVEDDDDLRGALAAYLEGAGYAVVEAEDGKVALDQLRASRLFCLILLDLFMPIPVVVVSADTGTARKATALGAVGHLVKPVDFGRLLALVAQYC
jgi:CheY-like chemotaxis protein